jgi:hypothetical protein
MTAGCVSEPLRGEDDGALSGHGRFEAPLGHRPTSADPSAFRHALEVSGTAARGLLPTDNLTIGIERYRLVEGALAWKPTVALAENVSFSALTGLAYGDYAIAVNTSLASPAAHGEASNEGLGGLLGAEFRAGWEVVGLYGRATWHAFELVDTSQMTEVGLELNLGGRVTLQAAYRWWHLELADVPLLPFVGQDVELDVKGFTVGGVVRV